MKVIVVGNYPPRKCGIATFTENLVHSLFEANNRLGWDLEIEVIAMNDNGRNYDYPDIVKLTIDDHKREDYIKAAEYINQSGADLCVLQHEYGIFGGVSGLLILSLLEKLEVPLVTTLHTVLDKPDFHQKEVLKKIACYSEKLVIMNRMAISFLTEVYHVDPQKIVHIEHGVPDFDRFRPDSRKIPKEWKGRRVILTFGLISRNKGLETVIRALPKVVKQHPDVLYVILGKTHPNVVRESGEEYRTWLKQLAEKLGVERHVSFIDEYVSEEDLMNYLKHATVYVTPYLNKAQITSGTLSYAIGAGLAVVSTPYWHAEELLSDGRGLLFDFGDSEQLANILLRLFDDEKVLDSYRKKAAEYKNKIVWPQIGLRYLELFKQVIKQGRSKSLEKESDFVIPKFSFRPLKRLTDETGLLQHAKGSIPYYHEGYTLDDNARAIILAIKAYRTFGKKKYLRYIWRYLGFVLYMQKENAGFYNYLSYSRNHSDKMDSEDAVGRTIWALGYLSRYATSNSLFQLCNELFFNSVKQIEALSHSRGYANAILGLFHYTKRFPDQVFYLDKLITLADNLCDNYQVNEAKGWHWFDEKMTYDNGILPAALYKAYQITKEEKYLEIANRSTQFLESVCFKNDHLSLVGNQQWADKNMPEPGFAQQPVDAFAMVYLYKTIQQIKHDAHSKKRLLDSFYWFLGKNDVGIPVYDSDTRNCYDGIEAFGINQNQGAESNIAYLLSWLMAKPYFETEKPVKKIKN